MNDADDNKKKFELLKTARQLLQQEYVNARMKQHTQWIASSETSWVTNGALLPYPSGALYPTEAEVVAKALELYNLSNNNIAKVPQSKDVIANIFSAPTTTALTVETANVTQQLVEASTVNAEPILPPPKIIEEVIKPIVEEVVEEVITDTIEEEEPVEESPTEEASATPSDDNSPPATEKHSLLRNVLSSWLQKNKGS